MANLTAAQCRAARALLNWTLDELAIETGEVGRRTIVDLETCRRRSTPATVDGLRRTFERAGVVFIEVKDSDGGVVLLPRPAPVT